MFMLRRNAPRKIPGHNREPQRRRAATAMPLEGQIAETLGCTMAKERPNFPATK
jgi:hypothetical protein